MSFDKLKSSDKAKPKGPMDLGYMAKLKMHLKIIESWPAEDMGEPEQTFPIRKNHILLGTWLLTLFLQSWYIRKNQGVIELYEIGHAYLTCLMNAINCTRMTLILTKSYRKVVRDFVFDFHLFYHRHKSDFAEEVYHKVDKVCRYFSKFLVVQMYLAPFLFNLVPILQNIRSGMLTFGEKPVNGTYIQNIYFVLPFDYIHNFYGYLLVSVANMWFSYKSAFAFCILDLLLSIITFHTWGHLTLLNKTLRSFPRPASRDSPDWYTPEELVEVNQNLQELINHHRLIIRFVNDCSTAFGPCLAAYFSFHQVCCCILLLQCSKLDPTSLMEYGVLTLMVFQQMMQISLIFEIINTKSLELADSVYFLPWECMGVRERRIVYVFLMNVQNAPIAIKAMGLIPVGVRTMAAIIKTSLSYFVMLRTFT